MLVSTYFLVVDVFVVPRSVSTSDALLPRRRSSRHPYFRSHPRVIAHRGAATRGPQEVTSDRWWAAVRRKHCTAAESPRWCSVVPVLIGHRQVTTYYAPTDDSVG